MTAKDWLRALSIALPALVLSVAPRARATVTCGGSSTTKSVQFCEANSPPNPNHSEEWNCSCQTGACTDMHTDCLGYVGYLSGDCSDDVWTCEPGCGASGGCSEGSTCTYVNGPVMLSHAMVVTTACLPVDESDGGCGADCDPPSCDGGTDCAVPLPDSGVPSQCKPQVGDPIDVHQGTSFTRLQDALVPGALEPLGFRRVFGSKGDEWHTDGPLDGVPKPFGSSPQNGYSAEWWHDSLSLVTKLGRLWSVRDRGGALLRYIACSGTPCWATPEVGNASIRQRLQRTATGFVLYEENGQRLVFESPYVKTGQTAVNRYFLSQVLAPGGAVALELTYQQPIGLSCPQGDVGTGAGVPYLSRLKSPEGSLSFSYRALPGFLGATECVISTVSVVGGADGGADAVATTYTYALDGGTEWAGRIASAASPAQTQTYQYVDGGFRVTTNGEVTSSHLYDGGLPIADNGPQEQLTFVNFGTPVACDTGSNCCGNSTVQRTVTDHASGRADGLTGSSNLVRTFQTLFNNGQELAPRLYKVQDSCGALPGACNTGSVRYEWSCSSATGPGYLQAQKDKNDNWEVYDWAYADAGVGPGALERRSVKKGASSMAGTDALTQENFTYTYGSSGTQLLASQSRPSVLQSGQNAVTYNTYDASDRLTSTIRSGWTKTFDGSSWSGPVQRHVGTFYFTKHVCQGETTDDSLGRTLEVHGPCLTSGPSATDCDGGGSVPITQYRYWPATTGDSNANRLESITRFPTTAGTDCTVASGLTTTFQTYDAWGNALSVSDENGVVTNSAYDEQRLFQSTRQGQTTTFYHDNGKLSAVLHPEGDYDVSCYRTGTSGAGCNGGTWTSQLQWKAKSSLVDGSVWTEKVVYSYWPDGTVASETYRGACSSGCGTSSGEIRRVEKFAADAYRRPAWHQWGDGAGQYSNPTKFDGADNITGLGIPYNAAPAYCTGTPGYCAPLVYDRANRLGGLWRNPILTGGATQVMFGYDSQDNVATVYPGGCPLSNQPGNFAGCTLPPSSYPHDDFGNVLEVTTPWTDNGSGARGTTHYAYDAQGNVVVKQTPTMAQGGQYLSLAYDATGRVLSTTPELQRRHGAALRLRLRRQRES